MSGIRRVIRPPACKGCGERLKVVRHYGRSWPQAIAFEYKKQGWSNAGRCPACSIDYQKQRLIARFQSKGR